MVQKFSSPNTALRSWPRKMFSLVFDLWMYKIGYLNSFLNVNFILKDILAKKIRKTFNSWRLFWLSLSWFTCFCVFTLSCKCSGFHNIYKVGQSQSAQHRICFAPVFDGSRVTELMFDILCHKWLYLCFNAVFFLLLQTVFLFEKQNKSCLWFSGITGIWRCRWFPCGTTQQLWKTNGCDLTLVPGANRKYFSLSVSFFFFFFYKLQFILNPVLTTGSVLIIFRQEIIKRVTVNIQLLCI